MLLDEDEKSFIKKTNDIFQEIYHSEWIGDKLMECTRNEMKKEKYVEQYKKYEKCLEKKILKLTVPETFGFDSGGLLPHDEDEISLFTINKNQISRSIHVGYPHLASKLSKEGKDPRKIRQLFMAVCLILAKSNLEHKFR